MYFSWFRRLWVVQEAVLAKEAIVICGSKTTSWDELEFIAVSIKKTGLRVMSKIPGYSRGPSDYSGFSVLPLINDRRKRFRNGDWRTQIPTLLHMSRDKDVSEPIDHAYAILGMLGPEVRARVSIDYSKASRESFWRAYVALYKAVIPLASFTLFLTLSSEVIIPELPSWCPNLNSRNGQSHITRRRERQLFYAKALPENFCALKVLDGVDELEARGLVADEIVHAVSLDWSHWDKTEEAAVNAQRFLDREQKCCRLVDPVLSLQNLDTSLYASVLVAGSNSSSRSTFSQTEAQQGLEKAKTYFIGIKSGETGEQYLRGPGIEARNFITSVSKIWMGRSFFVTAQNRFGLAPASSQPGDLICAMIGTSLLYIIRPSTKSGEYHILGECYFPELWYDEISEETFASDYDHLQIFRLV